MQIPLNTTIKEKQEGWGKNDFYIFYPVNAVFFFVIGALTLLFLSFFDFIPLALICTTTFRKLISRSIKHIISNLKHKLVLILKRYKNLFSIICKKYH